MPILKQNIMYGLLSYNYNNGKYAKGYYSPSQCNIGDYIQSLAARQYLPHIDTFVDRDTFQITGDSNGIIKIIMNAWWWFWSANQKIPHNFDPLFISIHLNNTQSINQETLDCLKNFSPIGCRDITTQEFLQDRGIDAWFSGCLTLTLGNTYKINDLSNERRNIYFIDYKIGKDCSVSEIDKKVSKILKQHNYRNEKQYYYSHLWPFEKNPNDGLRRAEYFIKTYANAKLVITTRLHCALPCLSLGTPVIFITKKYNKRYNGLSSLLNCLGYNENGKFVDTINMSDENYVYNSKHYIKFSKRLTHECINYIGKNYLKQNNQFQQIESHDILDVEYDIQYVRHKLQLQINHLNSLNKERDDLISKLLDKLGKLENKE